MKPKQLCAVRIGIDTFILPMNDGLKIVDIMSRARPVEQLFERHIKYRLKSRDDLNRVDLTLVRSSEIVCEDEPPQRRKPLLLPAPKGGAS